MDTGQLKTNKIVLKDSVIVQMVSDASWKVGPEGSIPGYFGCCSLYTILFYFSKVAILSAFHLGTQVASYLCHVVCNEHHFRV